MKNKEKRRKLSVFFLLHVFMKKYWRESGERNNEIERKVKDINEKRYSFKK